MMLFNNMISAVTLGNVQLNNVSSFEITESIDEIANTAKLIIPRSYKLLDQKAILEQFKVGDKATIKAGYYYGNDVDLQEEFSGYIKEVSSDFPLEILLEDESFILRQTNFVKSYQNATLEQVLYDIVPKGIKIQCPKMPLGRFQISNASAFDVLSQIKEDYGVFSRMKNGTLHIGLRDLLVDKQIMTTHEYILNPTSPAGNLVKKNDLKYKRKGDFKLLVKVSSIPVKGKKVEAEWGSKATDASAINITYPGSFNKNQLLEYAKSIYNKRCYDGYTGDITGFGTPRTHAGDALQLRDSVQPERSSKNLIEKVVISYSESAGISRKNTLSYRLV